MLYLFLAFLFVFIAFQILGWLLSAPRHYGPITDHFNGSRFINPGGARAKGLRELIKWMASRERVKWIYHAESALIEKPLPNVSDRIRVTFINHSSFLIQWEGMNILTDPVFSERASPFPWIGPKRIRPSGIKLEDLPEIQLVLLTHNHYDHLDLTSLKRIDEKYRPRIVTPLGVSALLRKENIGNTLEMDWGDQVTSGPFTIDCTPAQHFSGRGAFDRDGTLWCGYVVSTSKKRIYYVGDTGYNEHLFKEMRKRYAPFDITFIPIGAYKPSWFMSAIHCSPGEAVKIHQDTGAQLSIAMHFGTFPLADEGLTDPIIDLEKARREAGIGEENFMVLKEGVPRDFY